MRFSKYILFFRQENSLQSFTELGDYNGWQGYTYGHGYNLKLIFRSILGSRRCYISRLKAEVNNILLELHNSSYPTTYYRSIDLIALFTKLLITTAVASIKIRGVLLTSPG